MRRMQEYSLRGLLILTLAVTTLMIPWRVEAAEAAIVITPAAATLSTGETGKEVMPVPKAVPVEKKATPVPVVPAAKTTPVVAPQAAAPQAATPKEAAPQAAAPKEVALQAVDPKAVAPQAAIVKPATPVTPPGFHEVTVQKYGVIHNYATNQKTVASMLKDLGIEYAGKSMYPAPETPVSSGMVIRILGRFEKIETETEPVAYHTQYQDDNEMPFGKNEVLQAGIPGEDKVVYQYVLQGGIFQKQEIARERIKSPQAAIVKRGMARSVMTSSGPIGYKQKLTVESSAYTLAEGSGTGMTSIGIIPYEGIVAVDPNFIPYRTKMYIPGYGFAMAGDTGGAIRGYRIDLFMTSYYRAIQWGRRTIDIYIL